MLTVDRASGSYTRHGMRRRRGTVALTTNIFVNSLKVSACFPDFDWNVLNGFCPIQVRAGGSGFARAVRSPVYIWKAKNAYEKSLDQKESFSEHVVEWRQCRGRCGAQSRHCGSQAPGGNHDDARCETGSRFLDRCTDRSAAFEKEEEASLMSSLTVFCPAKANRFALPCLFHRPISSLT
jgi:hypothetical protein